MKVLTIIAFVSAALLFSSPAFAQPGAKRQNKQDQRMEQGERPQDGNMRRGGKRRGQKGQRGQQRRPNLAEMIKRMDRNADGNITKDELPPMMQQRFSRMDTNGDGVFDKSEQQSLIDRFSQRSAGQQKGKQGDSGGRNFEMMVQKMDKNGDGKLTKDELPERLRERFDMLDANGDGNFDKAEQQAAMERMRNRGGKNKKGNGQQRGQKNRNPDALKGQKPKRPDGNG